MQEKPLNRKGRGKGYNWDKGKSNNALSAENKGLLLAGAVAKVLKCSAKFIQQKAPYEEWHHVSGWFNKKKYYNLEKVKEWWSVSGKSLWEKEQVIVEDNLSKTGTECLIRFSEWINRKTVNRYECNAFIISQKGTVSSFEIRSEVWLVVYNKTDKKYMRTVIDSKFLPGIRLNKKIEFVK
jgi:hypothetical protein